MFAELKGSSQATNLSCVPLLATCSTFLFGPDIALVRILPTRHLDLLMSPQIGNLFAIFNITGEHDIGNDSDTAIVCICGRDSSFQACVPFEFVTI